MRVQEVVLGVWAGAVAAEGTLGHTRPASDRERRGMANGGARVPEVLTVAER